MTSLVTAVEGRKGYLICDPLQMVTLIWMSQIPSLPQRTANRIGDQWDAAMGTMPHAALVTAPVSLLGSAAFPRDPHLP